MLPRPERFVACPACACHVRLYEAECPHCGAAVRQTDGNVRRTVAAAMMGLVALSLPVVGTSACGDGSTGGSGGTSGSGGAGGTGGMTTSTGDGMGGAYGGAITDDDMDGYYLEIDDCNDSDPTIHPGAPETPGDMVDSNCDGSDDT